MNLSESDRGCLNQSKESEECKVRSGMSKNLLQRHLSLIRVGREGGIFILVLVGRIPALSTQLPTTRPCDKCPNHVYSSHPNNQ